MISTALRSRRSTNTKNDGGGPILASHHSVASSLVELVGRIPENGGSKPTAKWWVGGFLFFPLNIRGIYYYR